MMMETKSIKQSIPMKWASSFLIPGRTRVGIVRIRRTVGRQYFIRVRDRETLKARVYQFAIKRYLYEMDELYPEGYYFIQENPKPYAPIEDRTEENDMERQQPLKCYNLTLII